MKFSSAKNEIKICRKTRPDTAKLLAFLKSAAKNTPSTIHSFTTSFDLTYLCAILLINYYQLFKSKLLFKYKLLSTI